MHYLMNAFTRLCTHILTMHMQSTLHGMHAQMYGQMYKLIWLGHMHKLTLGAQW